MKKKKYKKKRMKTTNDNKSLASEIRHNYVKQNFNFIYYSSINKDFKVKLKKQKVKKNIRLRKRLTTTVIKIVCLLF